MAKKDLGSGSGLLADILAQASWAMRFCIVAGLLAGLAAGGFLGWSWLPAPEPGYRRAYFVTITLLCFGGVAVGLLAGLLAGTFLEIALSPFVKLLRPKGRHRRPRDADRDWDD
jgi:hypothetical protein